MLPVISWSEAIVDGLGLLRGPASLLPTTPQRWTFDGRQEALSGRTARLTSQWSTDGQSQRKFKYEWRTVTSRQKKTTR